jgi:predicted ATP-dependent serine protease
MKHIPLEERLKQQKLYKEFKEKEYNKKFFNFKRLEKHFGTFNLYMILGKKNIGKTTMFIKLMQELERKGDIGKIVYLRLEEKEIKGVKEE